MNMVVVLVVQTLAIKLVNSLAINTFSFFDNFLCFSFLPIFLACLCHFFLVVPLLCTIFFFLSFLHLVGRYCFWLVCGLLAMFLFLVTMCVSSGFELRACGSCVSSFT